MQAVMELFYATENDMPMQRRLPASASRMCDAFSPTKF